MANLSVAVSGQIDMAFAQLVRHPDYTETWERVAWNHYHSGVWREASYCERCEIWVELPIHCLCDDFIYTKSEAPPFLPVWAPSYMIHLYPGVKKPNYRITHVGSGPDGLPAMSYWDRDQEVL